jgi:hypothetical protein
MKNLLMVLNDYKLTAVNRAQASSETTTGAEIRATEHNGVVQFVLSLRPCTTEGFDPPTRHRRERSTRRAATADANRSRERQHPTELGTRGRRAIRPLHSSGPASVRATQF